MYSRLLSYDPHTDVTQIFHFDEAAGTVTIETIQPLNELLAENRDLYASASKHTPYRDGPLAGMVARIPPVIMDELKRSGIADDRKAFNRFLNDPNNRKFRTRPGEI